MSAAHVGSAPVATVRRGVLRSNAEAVVGAGGAVADLRHDAWGHGVEPVARALLAAGADAVRVDDAVRDALATRLGVDPVRLAPRGGAEIDLALLYGLPGAATAPVMRLSASVLLTKSLRAGEGVSYGYRHRAAADTRIALVGGGYAQGIVRSLGGRVLVSVAGAHRPVVGRVAMDACVVDVGDLDVRRGDEVVFFGDAAAGEPSLAEWARATGLSAAEIVTTVGLRARREEER